MAGGQLTPRQKMINMMYLVLTALLAMNVSKSVLDAFKLVDEGISNSNTVIDDKIKTIDDALTLKAKDSEEAKNLLAKTKEISKISDDLSSYIAGLKATLLTKEYAGHKEDNPNELEKLDDIDSPTRLLSDDNTTNKAFKGKEFQDLILETRKKFVEVLKSIDGLKPEEITRLENSFTLNAEDHEAKDGKPKKAWYQQFHHVPATGTMTLLTKIENDVLSTESSINSFLLSRVGALAFKFDKLHAAVQAEKAYLAGGSKYESKIFLTATSSDIVNETFIGNLDWSKFPKDSLGDYEPFNHETEIPFKGTPREVKGGNFSAIASVGTHSYAGAIKIPNPKGGFDWYPFKGSYEGAAAGGFSASPTKMNVLYIGVDNPMSVTVADARPGSLNVSLSGGSINKSGNGYIARVTKQGDVTLSASGKTPDGTSTKTFTAKFRVKRIPDPTPTLGGKLVGGNIRKGPLAAQTGIVPLMKDFDFEARFNVVSFDFMLSSKGEIFSSRGNTGPSLNTKIKNLLKRAKPKDIAIFNKIKVRGPDGQTRTLPSLTFNII